MEDDVCLIDNGEISQIDMKPIRDVFAELKTRYA